MGHPSSPSSWGPLFRRARPCLRGGAVRRLRRRGPRRGVPRHVGRVGAPHHPPVGEHTGGHRHRRPRRRAHHPQRPHRGGGHRRRPHGGQRAVGAGVPGDARARPRARRQRGGQRRGGEPQPPDRRLQDRQERRVVRRGARRRVGLRLRLAVPARRRRRHRWRTRLSGLHPRLPRHLVVDGVERRQDRHRGVPHALCRLGVAVRRPTAGARG